MDVDPTVSTHRSEHDGATFHFCSARCKATFDADPASYSSSGPDALADHDGAHEHHGHGPSADGAASTPAPGEVAEWTCPMHPEIRRPGPGSCPICGMALEPVMVTADSGPSPELADMTRRFWTGVALSIPVVILGMGGDLVPAIHDAIPPRVSAWLQLIFATPVVAQRILAAAFGTPVSVGTAATEGGAWGMALLAGYMQAGLAPGEDDGAAAPVSDGAALPDLANYLDTTVFVDQEVVTIAPDPAEVAEFTRYLEAFDAALPLARSAAQLF